MPSCNSIVRAFASLGHDLSRQFWGLDFGNRANQREATPGYNIITFRASGAKEFLGTEGRALTWWNTLVQTRGWAAAIAQPWEDFKKLLMKEYCHRCNQVGYFTRYYTGKAADEGPRPTCYKCGDPNHFRRNFPRMNRATTSGGNRLNPMLAIEGNTNQGNNRNRAQGRAFGLGIDEAPHDPNVMTEVHEERPEGNLKQLKTMKVNEPKLKDISVVREFPSVVPEDLSGLPLSREVEFCIDLILGAMHIAKSPYCLAHMEMQELSNQLKEL
uniref:Putative reverse transcriptase domain-containing protein n=1 Tax=Tanacetum cinerariifolium TaxID=118510 RepID=A0A6L2N228_TANCI|nr:putative reverse transcriptase domain-containing protein [Tanacetum cinerariifolium]